MCGLCHVSAYCSKACVLHDYYRHRHECKLHCPRLKLLQDFERCIAPGVRIKHTSYPQLGLGMFARRAYKPGDRILEDVVQYDVDKICRIGRILRYIRAVDVDGSFKKNADQQIKMTKGCHGFWSLFINHSCLPNATVEMSECGNFLLVTAIRPIEPGHEICYAYFHAVYMPLELRSPLLRQILGRPCICLICLMARPALEYSYTEMWQVVQHAYGNQPYEVFEHSDGKVDVDLTYAIANRIIDIALSLFGVNLRAADPWLAYIYNAVIKYVEDAHKINPSKTLSKLLAVLRKDGEVASDYLGFCTSMNIKLI